jgi:hypothetical protein
MIILVAKIALILFYATISQYQNNDPQQLAILGLAGVVAQLVIRQPGCIFHVEHEKEEAAENLDGTQTKCKIDMEKTKCKIYPSSSKPITLAPKYKSHGHATLMYSGVVCQSPRAFEIAFLMTDSVNLPVQCCKRPCVQNVSDFGRCPL